MSPDHDASDQRQAIWSDYWKQGSLHSLCGSFAGNYEGRIRAFWLETFSPLVPAHRIIDLCTGNGALPQLLCATRPEAMPRIDAVDLADIAPDWLRAAPQACRTAIDFHGGVRTEALPFRDRSFDLVVSQYGLEYTRIEPSLAEVARVIKPGGRIALILHHAQSRLADVAGEEVRLIDWLLQDTGFMDAAAAIYPFMAMVAAGQQAQLRNDPRASTARDGFNAAMQSLQRVADESPVPDLLLETRDFAAAQIDGLLRSRHRAEAARSAHEARVAELRAVAFRHRELTSHALTEDGIAGLAAKLSEHGFTSVAHAPIHHQAHLMGWTLQGALGQSSCSRASPEKVSSDISPSPLP